MACEHMAATTTSVALLEVGRLGPALVVADRCVKSAGVKLLAVENTDSGALCLKLSGPASAVAVAAEIGSNLARRMGTSVWVTVLPAPLRETMNVINSPPTFSPLLGVYDTLIPREVPMDTQSAIGLLETQGLVANLHATDVMLKAADVHVLGKEKIGGGYVTVFIKGDLAAVQAAVEAGKRTVEQLGGKLIHADVISHPHPDLAALLPG
jgi:microcompartment protein CcmL/EutN